MNTTHWQDALKSLLDDLEPEAVTEQPSAAPAAEEPVSAKITDTLTITFERKGRGGKCATIIYGFTVADNEITVLAADMKKALGTGGSARGGEILIQGDRRDDVRRFLAARGFRTKG